MKDGIHPKYEAAKISCICGNVIETRTTVGDFDVQICSSCHPFFTGKQKFVDTAGRVERFKRRYADVGIKKQAEGATTAETEAGAEVPAENPTA